MKPGKKLVAVILWPLAMLYGTVMEIRNRMFDLGILPRRRFRTPVISVGNISAGGTGKTPFTIFLAEYLSASRKVAIVSRGYRRRSRGVQLVSDGERLILNAEEAGDEPCLMARRVRKAVVVVAESRVQAVMLLEREWHPDVIILDDAFQHRYVARDADIVLLNPKEAGAWQLPLPAGRLREFRRNLKRADLIIHTNTPAGMPIPECEQTGRPQFTSRPRFSMLVDREFRKVADLTDLPGMNAVAFCGIAHPGVFFAMLAEYGVTVKKSVPFKDHHRYTVADCQRLLRSARELGCSHILCTEKDLVKLGACLDRLNPDIPFAALKMVPEVDDARNLLKEIETLIDKD